MPRNQKDFTYDNATLLKDAGAVTVDGAATVAAAARILDLGAARMDGRVIIDITAMTVGGASPEFYALTLQLSNSSTFASGVVGGATIRVGSAASLPGESANTVVGRFESAFTNEVNGIIYRYARIYTDVTGTAPSINFTAYLANLAF